MAGYVGLSGLVYMLIVLARERRREGYFAFIDRIQIKFLFFILSLIFGFF